MSFLRSVMLTCLWKMHAVCKRDIALDYNKKPIRKDIFTRDGENGCIEDIIHSELIKWKSLSLRKKMQHVAINLYFKRGYYNSIMISELLYCAVEPVGNFSKKHFFHIPASHWELNHIIQHSASLCHAGEPVKSLHLSSLI